jgi:hypothetical protein
VGSAACFSRVAELETEAATSGNVWKRTVLHGVAIQKTIIIEKVKIT